MTTAPPVLDKAETDAFAAFGLGCLGWLLSLIVRLGAPRRSRTLRRWIEKLERFVEHTIFLMAMQLWVAPPGRRIARPANARIGFRRAMRRPRFVFKLARIRARGQSWRLRIKRLNSVLARPAPYVARVLARLRHGLCLSELVPAAPPASACADLAVHAVACVDSS